MIKDDMKLLDETLVLLKEKTINESFHKFDFYLILCLDIVRYELYTVNQISDLTARAIKQFSVFQAFEFYYRDFPHIYSKSSTLFETLTKYNKKLKNNDELSLLGVRDKDWITYFDKVISKLILASPPNNK